MQDQFDPIVQRDEKISFWSVFFFPLFFIAILWLVHYSAWVFEWPIETFGIYPREWKGVTGILLAPLIHADVKHLFSNSVPLLVLGGGLFYFYRPVAYRVFLFTYVVTGFWVWISARPAFHIGASGVVYGLAAFLFLSGVLRKNKYLMAFSLFVVFLYGSFIWGVLPMDYSISWESHLMGGVAGLMAAWHYRKIGIQRELYSWETEPDESEPAFDDWKMAEPRDEPNTEPSMPPVEDKEPVKIVYIFKEKDQAD